MGKVIKTLVVKSKKQKYPVIFGEDILDLVPEDENFKQADKCIVYVNKTVYKIYQKRINNIFNDIKKCRIILIGDGEKIKQYKNAARYLAGLLKNGYTRNSLIVAIGGGVTGDFAGFIAAVYMRGIKLIHVPTTLLAMVDSSIGGKAAVNLKHGKNMIGAFYPPVKVVTDISFLKTLEDNELRNGIAESLKHAFIGEKELFEILKESQFKNYRKDDFLKKVVPLAAGFKVKVVEQDETEKGLRAILNFGHTIGHAIESYMKYKGISHGEAVAIGMKIVASLSRRMNYLSEEENTLILELIDKYGLIYNKYNLKIERILEHMKYDKKNKDDKVLFVLLKSIFKPITNCIVDTKLLEEIISDYMKNI